MAKFKPESAWVEPSFLRDLGQLSAKNAGSNEIETLIVVLGDFVSEFDNGRPGALNWRVEFARDCINALQGATPEGK